MLNYPLQNIANVGKTIYLFNRQKDGRLTIQQDHTFAPYFYEESSSGIFHTIDGKKVTKIMCREPSEVKRRRTDNSYEADVLYTKRFVIDRIKEVLPSPTKYLFIDIEIKTKDLPTYLNPDRTITCISAYNSLSKTIQTWYIEPTEDETDAENRVLTQFVKYIKDEQPDVLLGWNFVQFDYPYLAARIKKLWNIEFAEAISPIGKLRYGRKEDEIPYPAGISILDYLDMFKKIYRAEVSYSLDAISQKYLGTPPNEKVDFNTISNEIRLKNIADVQKLALIEQKQKVIAYYDEIRRMGKCFWEDLTWNSKVLDVMLLSEAKQKGIILPSKHYGEENIYSEEVEFEGAYRRCETGRYEHLHKLDLSSAYPMAIIDFCLDISNLTTNTNESKIEITDRETNEIKYPIYLKQNSDALLPTIARKLIIKKDYLKKQLKTLDPESNEAKDLQIKYDAVKCLVNSLFGVTALKVFRLYNVNIASAITSIVRDLLHYVETELIKRSAKVIYLDTDSVFVESKENPTELCNQLISQWAKEKYNKERIGIEFDYEGVFDKLLVIALCHYVGYLRKKDGKIKKEIKGVEAKRKDSSKFMQQFQTELIEKVLNNIPQNDIVDFIDDEKERIKHVPIKDVGFPCKVNAEKEYKSVPIFVRALEYTNEILDFKKGTGDTFYWIYVDSFGEATRTAKRTMKNKTTGVKEDKTSETVIDKNVLAYDEEHNAHIKNVDWKKMIEKTIIGKCEHIFEALDWDLSLIKEVKIKKVKVEKLSKEESYIKHEKEVINLALGKSAPGSSMAERRLDKPQVEGSTPSLETTLPSAAEILLEASNEEEIVYPHEEKRLTHKEIAAQAAKDLNIKDYEDKCLVSANVLPIVDISKEETFKVSHCFKTKAEITERTIMVAEAFGLGIDEEKEFVIYDNAEIKFKQGNVIYITGDSGSGKSWVLNNVFAKLPNSISINELKIDDNEVVVEGVGKNLNDALMKLNIAGLGDAFLYLRKYSQLSDGQKYRYRIAKFIDQEDKNVWILDEFCATLDRVTAKIVAYNLQKIARKLKKTVIVATTHTDLFTELMPDIRIRKGYESDVHIDYYTSEDWKDTKLEIFDDVIVQKGVKEDYEKLKKFHYRQAALGALKQVYTCKYQDEVVGVIVICYPHLALKGRNVALDNKFAKMSKENCTELNRDFDSIARVIIHPKYRGIGLSQYMLKEYFKLTESKYTETLAVMANYNPFFEKAGMKRIDIEEDIKRVALVKQLEEFGFNISLLSSATYNKSIFEKLSEVQQNKVKEIVKIILLKYKGQIAKLFSKDTDINVLLNEHLFEAMRELQRADTVYLIKQLK